MEYREATRDDADAIREVAHDSLTASYIPPLDDDHIETAVEQWYSGDAFADDLDGDDTLYVVADDDGDIVAFSQSAVEPGKRTVGAIQWLHVHPDHRDRGVGADLLAHTETRLFDAGVTYLEGRVLGDNRAGNQFYQNHGFHRTGERSIDVAGDSFTEHTYVKLPDDAAAGDLLEAWTTPDGDTVYVAFDERERGSDAPFYTVYLTPDRQQKHGYMCGNCESFDVSMGTMSELACSDCSNTRKADRWDQAYL
jgi:ribosomal protein S18 acetylase RimI-like enzyme